MDVYGLDCLYSCVVCSSTSELQNQNIGSLFPLWGGALTCRHLLWTADSLLSSAWYGRWCPDYIFFACVDFVVELQLDSVKFSQKESVRRTLFLDSQQPSLVVNLSLSDGGRSCHDTQIYLRVSQTCFFFCFAKIRSESTNFYLRENKCLQLCKSKLGTANHIHVNMIKF